MIYGKCLVIMFKFDLKVRGLRFPGKCLFLGHRGAIQMPVGWEKMIAYAERSDMSLRQLNSSA